MEQASNRLCEVLFGPLQEVQPAGGAERRYTRCGEAVGDPGKFIWTGDFSNAFNLVNRTDMLAKCTTNSPACILGAKTGALKQPHRRTSRFVCGMEQASNRF